MDYRDKLMYMKSLGINFNRHKPYGEDSCNKNIGILNGFFIYCRSYYYVVSGKIPFEMADYIFNNYNNDKFKIRVQGNAESYTPEKAKTCDEFEDYINNYTDTHDIMKDVEGFGKVIENKKKELFNTIPEKFYIEFYHIDTEEGLKIVVDYIKNNNIKTEW
jgi:hypothetical protein